jgi:hypothetical protein
MLPRCTEPQTSILCASALIHLIENLISESLYTCMETVTLGCQRHRDVWAQLLAQNPYLGVFWILMICSLVGGYQHFRIICWICLEAGRSSYFFHLIPLWQISLIVRAQKLRSQTLCQYQGVQVIRADWLAPSDRHTIQTYGSPNEMSNNHTLIHAVTNDP